MFDLEFTGERLVPGKVEPQLEVEHASRYHLAARYVSGREVLDFGCGLGGMLDAFAALGWETYGIDPSTRAAFARHRELTALPTEPRFDLVSGITDYLAVLRAATGR